MSQVRDVAEKVSGGDGGAWDGRHCVEVALRLLHQAVVRGVCDDYRGVVRKTVAALDDHITNTVRHITIPSTTLPPIITALPSITAIPTNATPKLAVPKHYNTICFDTSQLDTTCSEGNQTRAFSPDAPLSDSTGTGQNPQRGFDICDTTAPDSEVLDISATVVVMKEDLRHWENQVTRLIDVRTTLVEAATEFEAELECAVRDRIAIIRQEVERVIEEVTGHPMRDSTNIPPVDNQASSSIQSQHQDGSSTAVTPLSPQDTLPATKEDRRTTLSLQDKDKTGEETVGDAETEPQVTDARKDENEANSSEGQGTKTREADGPRISNDRQEPTSPTSPRDTILSASPQDTSCPTLPRDTDGLTDTQKQFVEEFLKLSSRIHREAEAEKLEMLVKQKTVVHNILEDNKTKLHTLCSEYVSRITTVTSLTDAVWCVKELAGALEERLSAEANWVQGKYEELVQQYTREQSTRYTTHTRTTQALAGSLTRLLHQPVHQCCDVGDSGSSKHSGEVRRLEGETEVRRLEGETERLEGEVRHLQAQLEARDNHDLESLDGEVARLRAQVDHDLGIRSRLSCDLTSQLQHLKVQVTQRHLQGLYHDRDWYKRLVGLLSQITLQLLHYYTVAQTLTQPTRPSTAHSHSQPPMSLTSHSQLNSLTAFSLTKPVPIAPLTALSPTLDHPSHPESTTSRQHDGSFLSEDGGDGWGEGGHYTSFTDDEAATTGLMGAAGREGPPEQLEAPDTGSGSGEGGSTCGSGLDSTGLSEGLLEDLDKDRQLRLLLSRICPHLLSVLSGRWERVDLPALEKETQELAISLQAAAGMVNIYIHSARASDVSSHTLTDTTPEKEIIQEVEKERDGKEEALTENQNIWEEKAQAEEQNKQAPDSQDQLAQEDSITMPDFAKFDLNDLTQSIRDLLNQGGQKIDKHQTLEDLDFTRLRERDPTSPDRLRRALSQPGAREDLQVYLHHLLGRLEGMKEQQMAIEEENKKLLHNNRTLAGQLQVAQDQLEELEGSDGGGGGVGRGGGVTGAASHHHYAAKMEASKDLRERVRSMLSAKKKSTMCREELIERVGELEGLVAAVISEADASINRLKTQLDDLTQQLETADRQLRSSRQFLEQQASERDQEAEELEGRISRLSAQLRDKDTQLVAHTGLVKEVESLERQLRDMRRELASVQASREASLADTKAAQDKIRDLREIIQTLESQVDRRGVAEVELRGRVTDLQTALSNAHTQAHTLSAELEELRYTRSEERLLHPDSISGRTRDSEEDEEEEEDQGEEGGGQPTTTTTTTTTSIFNELQEETDLTLLEMIEERLDRTTRDLETVQASSPTPLSPPSTARDVTESNVSDDDISEVCVRALSPSALHTRLEGLLTRLGRVVHTAIRHITHTQAAYTDLKFNHQEVVSERDAAETRWREQVGAVSGLEAKVEELRHAHPTTHTTHLNARLVTTRKQLDHTNAQLTTKAREVEELRYTLGTTRDQLKTREVELDRLHSLTPSHSLPDTATTTQQLLDTVKQLQSDVTHKNDRIEQLETELSGVCVDGALPPSLADSIVAGKNAELSELTQRLSTLTTGVLAALSHLRQSDVPRASLTLKQLLGSGVGTCGEGSSSSGDMTRSPEILRKSAPDNNNTTLLSQPATVKGGGIVSSPVSRGGSHEDHHATVDSSQPSSTDLTLISPHREPHLSLSKVSQVTEESHEGRSRPGTPHHVNNTTTTIKTRLEGDFHEAQRLLEERGAELEALTGEVEDQLAPSPPPQHLIRACTTLQQQNAVLQDKLAEVEGRNHERDLEVDGLREEGEEWRAERKLWVEERRKAAEELHKLMEERVNWIVDREKLLEEVKDQQKTKDQLRKLSDEMGKLIFEREKHLEESKEQRKLTEELRKLVDESGKWSAERGKLLEEAERHGKRIKQLEREVEEVRKVGRELRKEGERLHGVLKERERQVEELMADLRRRETELQELKMREGVGDTDVGRETRQLHQRYNQEITALKDQHIVREKQLCSDYEERMATQVGEVSRRLAREHETAVCRQRDAYQAALLQQQQQHPSGHHKHTQTGQDAHTGHDAHHPPSPTQQATSDLCASVDAAVARVRQQLEVSGRLDESLARLVGRRSNGDDDTRASSVASDASGGGGGDSTGVEVASHIQRLMAKVHQQGIEMLTLVELVYLQQHRGQLDSTQRSLLPFSPLPPRSASVTLSSPGPRERMQLTSHVARLEQELAASEQSTRTKLEALEWRVEQEQMSGREWQLSYEGERRRAREAEEQLRREKLNAADQAGELTRLRSQLFLAHLEMQKAQDEVKALSESIESRVRQGEGLQMSLDEERSNFSRVSRVLSHHRRHTAKIQAQQEAHVKDLCSSLETEREKILHLYGQLKESDSPPTSHATALTDLQMKLVVEKERRREAEAAFERERVRAATEREESRAEQGRVRVQLGEEQDRVTQLTRTARTNETHRQDLLRKLREERERVQQLESRVRECECEVRRLEGEVRTQSEVHREAAQRLRQEAHTLHIAHTRALNKLGEAEAEVCRVRQEASEALREAEVGSKREGQLRQELTTERTANERHGLPALARLKSVDEFVGVQLQENLELCKSVLRLTDQRQEAQVRIHSLEDTIDQLNSQLRQAHRTSQSGEMGNVDEAARERESEAVRWETERTSLLRMAELRESELTRLRAQVRVLHNPTTTTSTGLAVDEERLQYLYGRYLTAEHRVKALTWQKRYLLVVLRGYTTTETHTLARLHSMAAPYLPNTPHRTLPEQTPPTPPLRPRYTFRVVAVGVVAVVRMRGLVERYKRKKRLGWRVMFSDSDQRRTNTRSPLPSIITPTPENSRPGSSSSGLLNVRVSDRTVGGMTIAVESGRRSVEGYAYGITSPTVERTYVGVTSPTAEGTYRRPMSPSIERPSRPDYIRLSRRTEGSVNIGGRTRSLEGSLDMDGRTRGLEGAVDIGGTRIASGVYGAVGGTSRRTQWSSSEALHHVGTTGTSMGSPGRVYAGASGGAVGGTGIPDDTEIHRREGVRLRDRAHGGAIGGTELHGRSGVHGGAISRWSTGTLPRELAQPTTPREIREGGGGRGSVSFTGQTPPTKEPTSPGSHITTTRTESRSHRSLFPESKSRNWNEYIERVDNINTTLGFYPKQT